MALTPQAEPVERRPLLERLPWFALFVTALTLLRFLHMGEIIEEPWTWRQYDTEYFARDLYLHGMNILRPSVCWLGGHRTVIFEFPLHEAIVALFYLLLGPKILWARLVTFGFFLGSAYYFFKVIEYVASRRLAKLATVVYMALPMSLFYSRAVHLDFCVLFFAHGMLYYLLRGYDEEKTGLIALGSLFAALGFLIKAPYLFYLAFPLAFHILRRLKVKRLLVWSPILVLPVVLFVLWRAHVAKVNARAPDWTFISDYHKFIDVHEVRWYFGTLADRLKLANWAVLVRRVVTNVTTVFGAYLVLVGVLAKPAENRGTTFFRLWGVGLAAYLLIFFTLNVVHTYWQMPFVPVAAIFVGIALEWLFWARGAEPARGPNLPFLATLCALVGFSVLHTETPGTGFYGIDWRRIHQGQIIRDHTPENALLILAQPERHYHGFGDPRALYTAGRSGWNVNLAELNQAFLASLRAAGAHYLVVTTDEPLTYELRQLLARSSPAEFESPTQPWRVYIYDLGPAPPPATSQP